MSATQVEKSVRVNAATLVREESVYRKFLKHAEDYMNGNVDRLIFKESVNAMSAVCKFRMLRTMESGLYSYLSGKKNEVRSIPVINK